MTRAPDELLLGEWACLGILASAPAHGFAVAARLKPDGDVGRVWSLSRALTYRALDQLATRGYLRAASHEPGLAGGNRTILAVTPAGRKQLRRWLSTPVPHLRDLRSELLLKLVLADVCGVDATELLQRQRVQILSTVEALAGTQHESNDVVHQWRCEVSQAALRFVDATLAQRSLPR